MSLFKKPTLTSLAKTCGWAAKLSPVGLGELLAKLPRNTDPSLLVGFETSDDAAVYRLDDDRAVVLTADFITPPVDDPATFGRIAAANALSDVYAMGGRPLVCLGLFGFPSGKLGDEVLHGVMRGALETITAAGAVLAGGHTIDDEEPKFGLSVMGLVHPERIWRNVGAQVGDALVLTKPLGTGVLFNGNLKGKVSPKAMEACLESAQTLNAAAAGILAKRTVHACTDVTGFGLAGHAHEMAAGSKITLRFDVDALPLLDEALALYESGVTTGANHVNRALVHSSMRIERELPAWHSEILVDPQTSGGLLVALPADEAEATIADLRDAGVASARRIGEVLAFDEHHLVFG